MIKGIWILLVLIFTSALPVIVVFFWLRAGKSSLKLPWFLLSLAAGIISLLAAALIQNLIPSGGRGTGPGLLFFRYFVRIALVEEASRFLVLVPLFKAKRGRSFAAALGLVAGLGFATLENAIYGIADVNIALLRAFSASPLHGACGIRAGAAVFCSRESPASALFLSLSAVFIHGAYNLIIDSPFFPSALAILVAFAALFASLHFLKNAESHPEELP